MHAKPARDIHLHTDADEALQFDAAAPPAKRGKHRSAIFRRTALAGIPMLTRYPKISRAARASLGDKGVSTHGRNTHSATSGLLSASKESACAADASQ